MFLNLLINAQQSLQEQPTPRRISVPSRFDATTDRVRVTVAESRPPSVRNEKGETLDIEFLTNEPSFERIIAPFVRNLRAIGIRASIRRVDSAQYERRIKSLDFDGERPVKATWAVRKTAEASQNGPSNGQENGSATPAQEQGEIGFDYLVDASGRAGIMATHYLQNRRYHKIFQNVAIWGYWENVERLPAPRDGAIAVGSIPHGWIWAIPFSDGRMSVGVVIHNRTDTAGTATVIAKASGAILFAFPKSAAASVTGTAFPNCRIVSDHAPWNTKSSGNVCSRALSRTVK